MKRTLSIFLALVMVVLLVPTMSAVAANDPIATIKAPSSVKVGDEVTITVELAAGYEYSSATLNFKYDTNIFSYVSSSQGAFATAGSFSPVINDKVAGEVFYTGYTPYNTTKDGGECLIVVLKANVAGTCSFTLDEEEYYDAAGDEIELVAANAVDIAVVSDEVTTTEAPVTTAAASGNAIASINAPASVKVGEEVTAIVNLKAGYEYSSATVNFKYDPAFFQYVSSSQGSFATAGSFSPVINSGVAGEVFYTGYTPYNTTKDGGECLIVVLKALKAGATQFTLDEEEYYDAAGEEIACDPGEAFAITVEGEEETTTTAEETTTTEEETTTTEEETTTTEEETTTTAAPAANAIAVINAPKSVKVDDEVTVIVNLKAGYEYSSATLNFKFDTEYFSYVSASQGAFATAGSFSPVINDKVAGEVFYTGYTPYNTTKDGGEVLVVVLKALKAGSTRFALDEEEYYDAVGEEIVCDAADAVEISIVTEDETTTTEEETTTTTEPAADEKLELVDGAAAKLEGGYVYISEENMSASAVIALFKNEGVVIAGSGSSTGAKVQLIKKDADGKDYVADEAIVVLLADVDGDGMITCTDILFIKKALLKIYNLEGAEFEAADVEQNDDINVADYTRVKLYFLHVKNAKITVWLGLEAPEAE